MHTYDKIKNGERLDNGLWSYKQFFYNIFLRKSVSDMTNLQLYEVIFRKPLVQPFSIVTVHYRACSGAPVLLPYAFTLHLFTVYYVFRNSWYIIWKCWYYYLAQTYRLSLHPRICCYCVKESFCVYFHQHFKVFPLPTQHVTLGFCYPLVYFFHELFEMLLMKIKLEPCRSFVSCERVNYSACLGSHIREGHGPCFYSLQSWENQTISLYGLFLACTYVTDLRWSLQLINIRDANKKERTMW